MKAKRYKIDSLEKLLNVINEDNAERFSIDLAQYLYIYAQTIGIVRKKFPKETKGMANCDISKGTFIWIDDGKNGVKSIEITNSKTGETNKIKIK